MARAFELNQRLGRSVEIESLYAATVFIAVRVDVAVATVAEQSDHRTVAATISANRTNVPRRLVAFAGPRPAPEHGADAAGGGDRCRGWNCDYVVDHSRAGMLAQLAVARCPSCRTTWA